MSTIKNITDSYTINVPLMTVNGNLVINGNTTTVESQNLTVYDNIITLNGNVTGTPTLDAAIEVNRGSSANVALRWSESSGHWQVTNDGATYYNIATAGGVSGNINITGVSVYDTANTVILYTGTVSSGKSGLLVDNSIGTKQELATTSAAIAYSIIFG
jgi:P pilus assembly chaperone PapD